MFGIILIITIASLHSTDAACSARYQLISGHSACLSKSANAQTSALRESVMQPNLILQARMGGRLRNGVVSIKFPQPLLEEIPPPLSTNTCVSEAEQTEIVNRHNHHRAGVNPTARNMLKMSWDVDVAGVAQKYADNCVYAHDSHYKRILPGLYDAGQNIAYYTGTHSWTLIIDLWHGEVAHFAFGTGTTNGSATGHYTQVVWAKSHKIGCGYAYCTNINAHFYVCNYSPAGNISPDTNTPYSDGTTCGDCPNTCNNNLCDCSGQDCYNDGTLNVNTCTCACNDGKPFYVGDSCALNCTGIGTPNCGFSDTSYCSQYANVPFLCPVMCGWCVNNAGDSTSYLTTGSTGAPSTGTSSTTTTTTTTTTTQGAGGRGTCLETNFCSIFMLILCLFTLV